MLKKEAKEKKNSTRSDLETTKRPINVGKCPLMLFFLLQCPSTGKILSYLGFSSVSQLTVEHLERICSGVLTQLLLPSCLPTIPTSQPPLHHGGELLHRAAGLFVRPPSTQIL